ncbi:MAG: NAD(P)/FAD-dependent oxidoreductase [bacterium]
MLKSDHYAVVVVGAGPAGLIAAIESYKPSQQILILEKMPKPALKLTISGKGRCNITNDADINDFIAHFGKNGRFLKFSFAEFSNKKLLQYFERLGVRFKLERGGRYFPQGDRAEDVVNALLNKVKSLHIPLIAHAEVTGITNSPENTFIVTVCSSARTDKKNPQIFQITADNIVLAAGGKSYPKTGSNGAGYALAAQLGHMITPLFPALVPLITEGNTAQRLQGLSLKNVQVNVWCNHKKIDERFGEMVFTDFGLSGPIILSLSNQIVKLIESKQKVFISIDFKPALSHRLIDQRLLREINEHGKKGFKNLLKNLLPRKLIPIFTERLHILKEKQLNTINAEERKKLKNLLKEFQLEIIGHRSFDNAIATSGGVSINEINPQTMESKLVNGLYFAGEIIDVDADTGGFNLQAAFSTGWVAGRQLRGQVSTCQL